MGSLSRRPAPVRRRGFTLFELVAVICIVALLVAVALERLQRFQELGERTAMEQNLAAINVALTYKFAALIAAGRAADIEKEVGANPVDMLARPPANYLGVLPAAEAGRLPPRSWYFDPASEELVYLPGRTRFLVAPADATTTGLRFQVALVDLGPRADGLTELRPAFVRPRQPYVWIID